MKQELDELFDAYIDEEFGGYFRTEGCEGVRNLENICRDLGYSEGQFVGHHYIANFLADNSAVVELLFEFIRDGVCNPHNPEWAESLDLESYQKNEDEDEYNEFVVEDDEIVMTH
jgi:hypothetical protein